MKIEAVGKSFLSHSLDEANGPVLAFYCFAPPKSGPEDGDKIVVGIILDINVTRPDLDQFM